MERLTELDELGTPHLKQGAEFMIVKDRKGYLKDIYGTHVTKLSKLEDLEEEIGCPLEVIFKALDNGIYYEDVANRMKHISLLDLHINSDFEYELIDYKYEHEFLLNNYKKTWWLKENKEE